MCKKNRTEGCKNVKSIFATTVRFFLYKEGGRNYLITATPSKHEHWSELDGQGGNYGHFGSFKKFPVSPVHGTPNLRKIVGRICFMSSVFLHWWPS